MKSSLSPIFTHAAASSKPDLLSWLERGIAEPDESGDLTEFLVAPLQFKGADRRQSQAMGRQDSPRTGIAGNAPHSLRRRHPRPRRTASFCATGVQNRRRRIVLLTGTTQLSAGNGMACTSAMKFARASMSGMPSGTRSLKLLERPMNKSSTPLPRQGRTICSSCPHRGSQPSCAASHLNSKTRASLVRTSALRNLSSALRMRIPISVTQGGQISRSLGNAVHKLLEELARLRTTLDWDSALIALEKHPSRALPHRSVPQAFHCLQAENVTAQAFDLRSQCRARCPSASGFSRRTPKPSANPAGPVSSAVICASCASTDSSAPASNHCSPATTPSGSSTTRRRTTRNSTRHRRCRHSAPPSHRNSQMYADVLRNLHSSDLQLRAGLYYPRMSLFDWWEI